MRTILGLVGAPASGKGTVAAYCKERHGAATLRFSEPLFEILRRVSVEPTRDHLIRLSEFLRGTYGEDVLARAIAARVAELPDRLVVVDGVRREADIAELSRMPGFRLVSVTAPPETRYERSRKRREKPEEADLTYAQFLALEERSTEASARELEKRAETVLDNRGSFEELHQQVDALVGRQG